MVILKLDYDRPRLPAATYRRIVSVCRWLRLRPELLVARRTVRGWHVKVRARGSLSPAALVAVQAILGSDPGRETFNLIRARALRRAPRTWRNPALWNVLFLRKKGGSHHAA